MQYRDVLCVVDGVTDTNLTACIIHLTGSSIPPSSQACNTQTCASVYWTVTSKWSTCSHSCDDGSGLTLGVTTRSPAQCMVGFTTASDAVCIAAGLDVPMTSKPCNRLPCPSRVYTWKVVGSTECVSVGVSHGSRGCGMGTINRTVVCCDDDGSIVSSSLCPSPRPSSTIACDTGVACICKADLECGVHGVCDVVSGSCGCERGWTGRDCSIVDYLSTSTTSGDTCDGVRDARGICCSYGIDAVTGVCCNPSDVMTRDGRCCDGMLDGCGECNGDGVGVDSEGTCCKTPISPMGRCCDGMGGLDNCGVCGGTNSCSASVRVSVDGDGGASSVIAAGKLCTHVAARTGCVQ